jgi:urease accessory protein
MDSGGVGKNGFLRLGFARRELKTGMVDVERRVPFLVQRALYWDEGLPDMACIYLITTSGGILQGDRYSLEIEVGANARAHLTTQGSTKIQSMDSNYAAQAQTIRLRENAYMEFIPEPIIPFRNSRFITDTVVERDPTATLLYSEILVPGRRYHHVDECFGFDVFSARVRAFDPAGRETFCEKYILEPKKRSIRQLGVMGDFDIYANVLLLTPKVHADAVQAQVGAGFSVGEELAYGSSRLPNDAGLVFKVLGNELKPVKKKIRDFWTTARSVVTGATLPPPFLWR